MSYDFRAGEVYCLIEEVLQVRNPVRNVDGAATTMRRCLRNTYYGLKLVSQEVLHKLR